MNIVCVIFAAALALLLGRATALQRRDHYGLLRPPDRSHQHQSPPPEQWFTQKLDHFRPADTRTWKQRYFVNAEFEREGGPLFLMIGGEGTADPVWMTVGSWLQYARQHGAVCLMLEHRFYGRSHPTSDMSVKNLRYLSSAQALADLAQFLGVMRRRFNVTSVGSSRVVVFGGSYPGSLAAWLRLKYPHLVHAAVATSAPLLAKTDFYEFLTVVTSSLRLASGADHCFQLIRESFSALSTLLREHSSHWQSVTDQFRLCEKLDGDNAADVSQLFSLLANWFESVVQYNEDNRSFEHDPDANITINSLCTMMSSYVGGGQKAAIDRLADVNLLFLALNNQSCLQHTYKTAVSQLRNTRFDSDLNNGGRQWFYQTCTEFGWYQTSDASQQPFGHHFPLSFSVDLCRDVFGARYTVASVNGAVDATNTQYGGGDIVASRVVFVNGNVDPWHAMGLTHSTRAAVIYINGTAHCANMYPARASDLPGLVEARQRIGQLISTWLTE